MARLVITRPNGEVERAELTTDKALAGNDRLSVVKAGTVYYAKLDSGVSTHMYVIKPDGRKLYVQKEVKFVWKYVFDGTWENASKMVIPRTGKYKLVYTDTPLPDFTMETIFLKGKKFSRPTWWWGIQDKNGEFFKNVTLVSKEGEEDREGPLASIEYIGEA